MKHLILDDLQSVSGGAINPRLYIELLECSLGHKLNNVQVKSYYSKDIKRSMGWCGPADCVTVTGEYENKSHTYYFGDKEVCLSQQ